MTTLAETLCAEHGLNFARGFSQQFHCAKQGSHAPIAGFTPQPFGD